MALSHSLIAWNTFLPMYIRMSMCVQSLCNVSGGDVVVDACDDVHVDDVDDVDACDVFCW